MLEGWNLNFTLITIISRLETKVFFHKSLHLEAVVFVRSILKGWLLKQFAMLFLTSQYIIAIQVTNFGCASGFATF